MKRMTFILSILSAVSGMLVSCSGNYPGTMDDPQPDATVITVTDLNSSVSVPNGIYDLEVYAHGSQDSMLIVTAGDRSASLLMQPTVWSTLHVRGIAVTEGKVALTCHVLEPGATYEIKTAYLRQVSALRSLITGGDLSMLSQVEKNGGKYYDENGKEGDCFEICSRNGMNLARLRLYNDPGNPDYYPSKTFFPGIQDEANVLALARRAKAAGMEIELTFHYSDSWTNGGEQFKPHAWKDYSQEQLHEAMYTYTRDFLKKMAAQGTAPQYVSLGNEIQSGILFGRTEEKEMKNEQGEIYKVTTPTDSINGYCDDMMNLASLLGEGSRAVREVCPEAKIIIHLTTSADITVGTFQWFCSAMKNYNLDYDIIGASYYPFYGNKTVEEMIAAANTLSAQFDKDFIFMETGFAWNPVLEDGSIGQIANNDPYKDMTPEAQRLFLQTLTQQIQAGSGRILGFIYWDPVYMAAPNCGWAAGEKNVTGNSTLFDFQGHMLPAWDVFRFNN